jgi:hypothetical protein
MPKAKGLPNLKRFYSKFKLKKKTIFKTISTPNIAELGVILELNSVNSMAF